MNAPASTVLTEAQMIERSLDELLRVATSYKPPWPPRQSGLMSAKELMAGWTVKTPIQRKADAYLDDPVGVAVRRAIETLGERLHEIGGLQAMQDALYSVAAMDPVHESWRIDIMDKRFDGIGAWCC